MQADLADVLLDRAKAAEAITATAWLGVDLLGGGRGLAAAERALDPTDLRRLAGELDTLPDYDLIIIDCPADLGLLTLNALYASSDVLGVTDAELNAVDGIRELNRTVTKVQQYHPDLRLAGVIVNNYDQRETEQRRVLELLLEGLGEAVWGPPIPRRAIVKAAAAEGRPIQDYRSPEARHIADRYSDIRNRLTSSRQEATA